MKKMITFLVCALIYCTTIIAQNDWTQKASIGTLGRYCAIGCSLDGKGYVGMGSNSSGNYGYDFWEYNPINDSWTQKSSYPGGGSYAASTFAINGKVYVCLGANSSGNCKNDLWEYNPNNDTWLQKTSFPGTARYGASCFVINDKAYIGTGSYGNSSDYLFDFWEYDPATDTWDQKADFPGGKRNHATGFAIEDYGYLGLGSSNSSTATNDFWKYNPNTNTWSGISNFLGNARHSIVNFVINGKAYVGTGQDLIYNYNDFFEYNPLNNSWTPLISLPSGVHVRRNAIGFAIDNIGYFGTGYSTTILNDFWAFDPNCIAPLPTSNNVTINSGTSATLTATGGTNYKWYNVPVGGSVLSTNASYTTAVLNVTDTFYVTNTTNCESERVPVIVTVTDCPTPPPSVIGASRCGAGSLTLSASGGTNYLWYNAASGGNIVNMSSTYNTPTLSNTTTYYVSNFDSCESVRVPVIAHINNININAGSDKTISCGSSTTINTYTTYNGSGTLTYAWSPTTGLSSSSIASPLVQLSETTEYTVMVTDSLCSSFDIINGGF